MGIREKKIVKSYKDLEVWKKGLAIVRRVYEYTDKFPKKEQYGLAAQMQRAAVSIPSNIAEGFARYYTKDYGRFLYITLGSCAELETQAIIAKERAYLTQKELDYLQIEIEHESRMLRKLILSITKASS